MMHRPTRLALTLTVLVLLTGCGKKEVLKPAAAHVLPQKAKSASAQPGVTQLLTPTQQERPTRDNELVSKSKPLEPDRFDLPPPG